MVSFLLDENIPYSLVDYLEKRGHITYHVRKLGKAGIRNGEVYQLAIELKSWIVTRDRDFLSYIKFLSYAVPGVIVIETATELTRNQVVDLFDKFLSKFESALVERRIIVLGDDDVKILSEE